MPDNLAMALLGLVAGSACCHCRTPGDPLCSRCEQHIERSIRTTSLLGLDVVSAAEYAGVVRSIVLAVKRNGNPNLVNVLGTLAIRPTGHVTLVPVPSGRQTRSTVQGNLATRIAQAAKFDRSTIEMLEVPPLRRSQKSLSRKLRAQGPKFRVNRSARLHSGEPVVIFDDVVTTGSTISAAARALREADIEVVGAVAIARVER